MPREGGGQVREAETGLSSGLAIQLKDRGWRGSDPADRPTGPDPQMVPSAEKCHYLVVRSLFVLLL